MKERAVLPLCVALVIVSLVLLALLLPPYPLCYTSPLTPPAQICVLLRFPTGWLLFLSRFVRPPARLPCSSESCFPDLQ